MPGSPDVGDVLQETNLTLWNSRNRFEPGTNFLAWTFTVARLEVLNHRKRINRENYFMISDDLFEKLASTQPEDSNHNAYLRALEICKAKLPEDQQRLIDARYQQDSSLEDLARQTNRKGSALRVALMRIRKILRKCIEQSLNHSTA